MQGLHPLCAPPNATVDIVFVHGLHGDSTKTWTYGSGDSAVFWPEKLLPKFAGQARILTFGYAATIAQFWGRPSENRMDTFSNDLFQQLENDRSSIEATTRPIIFVAHSLGGLVCANGLVDATNGSEGAQELANCVRRIAFLGTPHRGSEKARWAETARNFIKLFKDTNKELTKDLDEKSEKLTKLGVSFPSLLMNRRAGKAENKIEIVCFYEGLTTKVGGVDIDMIVKESSACIDGYPRTLLDADHQAMCKFKDENDNNFKRVAGVLGRWAKELQAPPKKAKEQSATHTSNTTFSGSNNSGFQLGQNAGNINGFTFGGGK